MSIWSRIIESVSGNGNIATMTHNEESRDASRYAFVDCEVGVKDKKIHDIGALRWDGATFHSADKKAVLQFLQDVDFVCGHNIIHHDAKYLFEEKKEALYQAAIEEQQAERNKSFIRKLIEKF